MRIKHLFFMAVTAAFAFAACEDPIEGNDPGTVTGDGNFWTTYNLAPKGVKSITENGFTENYDQNGRLISTSRDDDTYTYTYNAEGYVSKIEYESEHVGNTTTTFEFNNGDKFCPIPMGPATSSISLRTVWSRVCQKSHFRKMTAPPSWSTNSRTTL